MIKLIKLCFVCCLIFRATFVGADYQSYKEYIEALSELEQKYRSIDKSKEDKRTIELSGHTMGYVTSKLRDILRLRADTKIGTSQKQDSHPALLKVNGVVYEFYFHGSENQPGNCLLKKQGGKPKAWLKSNGEYNSELNTEKNYIEQNLMFCLEIARRSVKRSEEPDCIDFKIGKSEKWILPIAKNVEDQFKDLDIIGVIVLGLNLVKQGKDCSTSGFFGSFDSKGDRAIIANNFIKTSMKNLGLSDKVLSDLKVNFFKTRIDKRIIDNEKEKHFKNHLSDMVKNKKIIEKLRRQNFTLCEQISEESDTTNFWGKMLPENVIKAMKLFHDGSSISSNCEDILKKMVEVLSDVCNDNCNRKGNNSKKEARGNEPAEQSFYVLNGNAKEKEEVLKFWEGSKFGGRKNFDLRGLENALGFLYATGKDGKTRWFYLDKSDGIMYLLVPMKKK